MWGTKALNLQLLVMNILIEIIILEFLIMKMNSKNSKIKIK